MFPNTICDSVLWSIYDAFCDTVSVKWQKEVFPSVEIDTSQPPLVFKCQLYALTGVPPERQKIMVKGGLLKVYELPFYEDLLSFLCLSCNFLRILSCS